MKRSNYFWFGVGVSTVIGMALLQRWREGQARLALKLPPGRRIDELMPAWAGRVIAIEEINRPRGQVYAALMKVRLQDMPVFQALMSLRALGSRRETPAGGRPAAPEQAPESAGGQTTVPDFSGPILAGMRSMPFILAEELHQREVIWAYLGRFWRLDGGFQPLPDREAFRHPPADCARAVTGYLLTNLPGGRTRLTIETRVKAPVDLVASRLFRLYWPLVGQIGAAVYGSSLAAAVKRLAES